jgi:hypothetical protein
MTSGPPQKPTRRAARRAFEDAQAKALADDRLHLFAHCTCGVDGLLFWMDREDDYVSYWVEWWTTQPGTRLPWRQRLATAWRILRRGTAALHELVLSIAGAEQLASWLLHDGALTVRGLDVAPYPNFLNERTRSWEDVELLFGVDTLIDAVVAKEVHDAGFHAGATHARRVMLRMNNIVPGGGTGGIDTIAAAHAVADTLEAANRTEDAQAVRNVARLAAGYWEDIEDFGRLKDALADSMGHEFRCPVDVMHAAIDHFKEHHVR